MLSIIIPHHTESKEIVHPLLASIDAQIGVDLSSIEILIVNDDEKHIIEDFSEYRNIKDKIYNLYNEKKGGPGPSRQYGIDHCRGEYIIFCDADDSLSSSLLFYDLAVMMRQNPNVDLFDYKFIEETRFGTFIPHDINATWVFSKVYRKGFLMEHNVRFHDELFYQEDSYFNQIFLSYNPRRYVMNQFMTVWRYNKNSITRSEDAEYTYKEFDTWVKALTLAETYIRDHQPNLNRREALLDIICSTYTQLQQFDPNRTSKYWDSIKEEIKKFISTFNLKPVLLNPTPQDNQIIAQRLSNRAFIPRVGFMEFYKPILEEITESNKEDGPQLRI